MAATIGQLIASLRAEIPLELRSAPPSGEYLEGVLLRQDLSRCHTLLVGHLGVPAKDFGVVAKLDRATTKTIEKLGGVWTNQCLFLSPMDGQSSIYAMLWPWGSDASRITLKLGIVKV